MPCGRHFLRQEGKEAVGRRPPNYLSTAVAGISPADMWMNLQTQYNLDTAFLAERENQRETIPVTIPVRDRNLLKEIVRKFGWACIL